MTESIIPIVLFLLLLFLCFKGIMWGSTLIVLIQAAGTAFALGSVLLFALPVEPTMIGPNLPYLPIIVSAFILLIAAVSIIVGLKSNNISTVIDKKKGFITFTIGVVLGLIGLFSCSLFIFGDLPGGPNPKAAVLTYSATTIFSVISFYISSKFGTTKFPNLFRWLSFGVSTVLFLPIFAFAMIFIFAYPNYPNEIHPFWASIISLNYVPFALLFIGLNRNFTKRNRIESILKQTNEFTLSSHSISDAD